MRHAGAVLIIYERSFVSAVTFKFTNGRSSRRRTRGCTFLRTNVCECAHVHTNVQMGMSIDKTKREIWCKSFGECDAEIICRYINSMNMYSFSHVIIYHIFLRQNNAVIYKNARPKGTRRKWLSKASTCRCRERAKNTTRG